MSQEDKTPTIAPAPETPPAHDDAPLQHAVQDAVTAIADVALAPVEEVLGHAVWLRWSLVSHLLATLIATVVALVEDFADWQIYAWTGLLIAVLVGNFMRWGPSAGWFHRTWTTLAALLVNSIWTVLLFDRARAGHWHGVARSRGMFAADASPWFWLPVALLLLTSGLLVVHGIVAPHYRLRRIHHKRGQA